MKNNITPEIRITEEISLHVNVVIKCDYRKMFTTIPSLH